MSTGGAQVNVIPRDGGNRFGGAFFLSLSGHQLQGNNVTDALRAQGVKSTNGLHELHDYNVMVSGPIIKDRVWFITSHRLWGKTESIGDLYEEVNPAAWVYTPDLSKPVLAPEHDRAHQGRVTAQVSAKDKIAGSWDWQYAHASNNQGRLSPTDSAWEVKGNALLSRGKAVPGVLQSGPIESGLFEAGFSRTVFEMDNFAAETSPGVTLPGGHLRPDIGLGRRIMLRHQHGACCRLAAKPRLWAGVAARHWRS